MGTSAPELVVSLKSALSGQGDLAVGNVVGSNIFNIGIILGLTALICPIPVHRQVIRMDAPIAVGVALLLPLLLWNERIGRIEGAALTVGIFAYTWVNIVIARQENPNAPSPSPETPAVPVSRSWLLDLGMILAGLALLIGGSRLLVDHAVTLARSFGVSEVVIGLTIIAAGTSMPELATSCVAAFRRQADIAIGNIVGSNIFNLLAILGISSLITPLEAPGISTLDLSIMIVLTVLLLPLIHTGRTLHRLEGALLLFLYGTYLYFLWPK